MSVKNAEVRGYEEEVDQVLGLDLEDAMSLTIGEIVPRLARPTNGGGLGLLLAVTLPRRRLTLVHFSPAHSVSEQPSLHSPLGDAHLAAPSVTATAYRVERGRLRPASTENPGRSVT